MSAVDTNDIILFASVAEAGSFSRAAERLQLQKSTVSRRMAALEKSLGERLFLRSTRKLTTTDFGFQVLEHARVLASEAGEVQALAQHRQARPGGRLRVSLPGDFAVLALSSMLTRFAREHPAIVLEIDLSARRVDLIGENFDLAVRIGDLPDDSVLAARKLGETTSGLYASPNYLERVGGPREPDDLLGLHALLLAVRGGEPRAWTLERGQGDAVQRWSEKPRARTVANSPGVLMRMAEAGLGVTCLPDLVADEAVRHGTLTKILSDWRLPCSRYWAVFAGRRLMPARTRAFLDALVAFMRDFADDASAKHPVRIERRDD